MVKLIQSWKLTHVLMALVFIFLTSCGTTSNPIAIQATLTPVIPMPIAMTAASPEIPEDTPVDEKVWNEIQQSAYIQGQYKLWQAWIDYWSRAKTPVFDTNKPLALNLLFDPYNLPKDGNDKVEEKVAVMLRWTDKTGVEHFSYFPRNTINPEETGSKFQLVPPDVKGREGQYQISDWAGTGPLDITNAVRRGDDLYRLDEKGTISEAMDRAGVWNNVAFDAYLPEKFKQQIGRVEQLPTGVWEAHYAEMLMAVKPNDGRNEFVSAPNGYALPEKNGMWYKWNGSEFKFSVDINSDKPNAEIEAVAKLVLKELKTGSGEGMYMYNEELMGAGLKIKPGMETKMMEDLWFAMYDSIILREQGYWKTVGFTGSSFEEFKAWAKTVGPIALKMPGPKSYGVSSGIVDYGATEIDSVGIIMLSKEQYQKDPFAKATADLVSLEKTMGWSGSPEYDRFGFKNIDEELYFVGLTRKSKFIDEGSIMTDNMAHSAKVVTFWYEQSVGIIRNTDPWRLGDTLKTESTTELMSWRGGGYGLHLNLDSVNRDKWHNLIYMCNPPENQICGYLSGVYSIPADLMTEEQALFVQR